MGKRGRDEETPVEVACLPIASDSGESDDEDGPQMDAFAYIRNVRKEAKRLNGTVVAANRDEVMQAPMETLETREPLINEYMVPKRCWRQQVVQQFISLRKDYRESVKVGVSSVMPPKGRVTHEWKKFTFAGEGVEPTLGVLQALDQVTLSWLVVCHKNWLCNSPNSAENAPAGLTAKSSHLYNMACQAVGKGAGRAGSLSWIYAILTSIVEPLVPADQTALAELLQTLCQLWKQVCYFFR